MSAGKKSLPLLFSFYFLFFFEPALKMGPSSSKQHAEQKMISVSHSSPSPLTSSRSPSMGNERSSRFDQWGDLVFVACNLSSSVGSALLYWQGRRRVECHCRTIIEHKSNVSSIVIIIHNYSKNHAQKLLCNNCPAC